MSYVDRKCELHMKSMHMCCDGLQPAENWRRNAHEENLKTIGRVQLEY